MKALLIAHDDRVYYVDIPDHHRGGHYNVADHRPMATARLSAQWQEPVQMLDYVRTFTWRGQIVRKNGLEIFDFFEEE